VNIIHQIADIQAATARVEELIHLIIPLCRAHSARGINYLLASLFRLQGLRNITARFSP